MSGETRESACHGPRDLKPFGSEGWCWQTINLLRIRFEKKQLAEQGFLEAVAELDLARAWEVVPAGNPYGSREAMFKEELGVDPATLTGADPKPAVGGLNGDFVTAADLIPYLGLSRGKVYRLIREGRIPSVRLGTTIRIPVAGLRRALAAGVTAAG
jgi:excisionase family DNA binding protein